MSNEQWLSDGKCSECRRQKYCSKPCRANKVAIRNLAQEAFLKAVAKGMKQKEEQNLKESIHENNGIK